MQVALLANVKRMELKVLGVDKGPKDVGHMKYQRDVVFYGTHYLESCSGIRSSTRSGTTNHIGGYILEATK